MPTQNVAGAEKKQKSLTHRWTGVAVFASIFSIGGHSAKMNQSLQLSSHSRATGLFLASFLLVACSAPGSPDAFTQVGHPGIRYSLPMQSTLHLFVANDGDDVTDVTMYALQSNKLLHRVRSPLQTQYSILDDSSGRLYVMDRDLGRIVVYGPRKRFISYIVSQGLVQPLAIALDTSGALYVANYSKGNVEVFASGSKTLLRTITDGIVRPVALAFDKTGNLFVANSESSTHSVSVYPPGGSHTEKIITQGIQNPVALATDPNGNLYVANRPQSGNANVKVYAAGTYTLKRTITSGVSFPASLAFDSSGDLYVGNATNISVYGPASGKVLRLIPTQRGGSATTALAFDASGVLYAAYQGSDNGGVALYSPGSSIPLLRIRRDQGVLRPVALAIGP